MSESILRAADEPEFRENSISVIGRAARILEVVGASSVPLGVTELGRRTALPKATVSRFVNELVELSLLERSGRSVRLGIKVFELGERAARPRDLRRAATAHMIDLARSTSQSVHLAVLDGIDVVYLQIERSRHAPPMPSQVGGRMPAHVTAVGKALLAYASPSVLRAVIDSGLPAIGPGSITSGGRLSAELESIRAAGLSYDREESRQNVACVASTIFAPEGEAVAAISVSGWSDRFDVHAAAVAVKFAAMSISRRIKPRE